MSYKSRLICLKCSLLAPFLLFLQPAGAQYHFENLDAAITAQQKSLAKDFAVLVWKKNDTLVYKKEMGEFNTKTQAPIASCSKWLTAALVMQFVDEGKLSLDDKITRWLPEYAKYGKNYITIRQCLTHMTGIQAEPSSLQKLFEKKKYSTLEDQVNAFAAKEIQTNPGTEFRYSTMGFNIAGRVLEILSKKRFDQLIKIKLFNPLRMRNTSFTDPEGGATDPSNGAVSTADDYMKFLVMLMNNGKYNGQQVLSENAVEQLLTEQVPADKIAYAPKPAQGFTYAYGSWAGSPKDGKPTVFACPSLYGDWAVIDQCRGYAYLVLVENMVEQKEQVGLLLKKTIDEEIKGDCP